MENAAIVTNIQKFSVHDGPGIRSVIFLKGCPLRCKWCANPENIRKEPQLLFYRRQCIRCGLCAKRCENGAIAMESGFPDTSRSRCRNCGRCADVCASGARVIKGQRMTAEEICGVVDRDLPFYRNSGGGITFSGGEPLLYPDLVAQVCRTYREKGLNTAVETCGCIPWGQVEQVLPWVDLFLFDLKLVNDEKHRTFCGVGNTQILENLRRLCRSGQTRVIIRMPVIPGINDGQEDLEAAAGFLEGLKGAFESVHCLPYHNYGASKYEAMGMEYELENLQMPEQERMEQLQAMFALRGLTVQIGG